jgi:hypothetical protein
MIFSPGTFYAEEQAGKGGGEIREIRRGWGEKAMP